MRKAVRSPPEISYNDVLQLMKDKEISTKAEKFNSEYYSWEEVYYHTDDEVTAIKIWTLMKFRRGLTYNYLNICRMKLNYNFIPRFIELLNYIDRDSAGHTDIRLPGDRDGKRFLISSMMEEAIASSQIEGASTTRRDAKNMLSLKKEPSNNDERMILNNYNAMMTVKDHINEDLTPELIKMFHKVISDKTIRYGSEWEGRFRESDDIVVGDPLDMDVVYHVPPKCENIPDLIEQLCEFANDNKPYMHPILKAITLHYLIGYIHPFVDGNGRLARSLFYWYSLKKGYWLFEYTSISLILKNSRSRYGKAYQYTESDEFDLTYFMKFNLECICKSIENLYAYLERKTKEQDEIIEIIGKDPTLCVTEADLLRKQVKDQREFTIYDVKNKYRISYQTARKYVYHLTELGYLVKVGKYGKQGIFSINNEIKMNIK